MEASSVCTVWTMASLNFVAGWAHMNLPTLTASMNGNYMEKLGESFDQDFPGIKKFISNWNKFRNKKPIFWRFKGLFYALFCKLFVGP